MQIGIVTAMRYGLAAVLCAAALAACTSNSSGGASPTRGTGTSADSPTSASSTPVDQSAAAYDDAEAVGAVIAAARADFPLVAAYDYRHLNADLAQGRAVTTGSFTALYETTMRKTIFPQALKLHVVQQLTITNVGIIGLGATQAEALVFADQKVTDTKSKTPTANTVTSSILFTRDGSQWKVSGLRNNSADDPQPPGTAPLQQAVNVGQAEVQALFTYHRKGFAQDVATAEAGASGDLLTSIKMKSPKVQTQLVSGAFDLVAEMHATAVETVYPRQVVLLVAADEYKVPDHGAKELQSRNRLQVDVVFDGARWHVDSISPVT